MGATMSLYNQFNTGEQSPELPVHFVGSEAGSGSSPKKKRSTPKAGEEERVISILQNAVAKNEWLPEEDMRTLPGFPLGSTLEDRCGRFLHLAKISILSMPLVSNFARAVPGFDTLSVEDQASLLKVRAEELLLIHFSRKYYLGPDSVRLLPNQTFYSRHQLLDTYPRAQALVERMFDIFRGIAYLGMDSAEYGMLMAIIIFTGCPDLEEPVRVLQERYIRALGDYSGRRRHSHILMVRLIGVRRDTSALVGRLSELLFSFNVALEDVVTLLASTGHWH